MENEKYTCIICKKEIEHSILGGSRSNLLEFTLKHYDSLGTMYFINTSFKVCLSCYIDSAYRNNINILEHAKKIIDDIIKGEVENKNIKKM